MTDFSTSGFRQLLRRLFGLGLIGLGVWLAMPPEPPILFIVSILCFVLALAFLLPEVMRPFTWMVDKFFGTGPGEGGKPPLDLRLVRFYVKEERFEDALEEARRIVKFHPYAAEAWEQAILMTAIVSRDRGKVDRIFRKANRKIKDLDGRAALRRCYEQAKEEAVSNP